MGTLYITEQGAVIARTGERLIIRKGQTVLQELPVVQVDQIVILGNASLTAPTVPFLLDKGIDVAYLSSRGTYRGRLQPQWTKDATVREAQYRRARNERFCVGVARQIIAGKIRNMVTFCRRQRRVGEAERPRLASMEALLPRLAEVETREQALGYEGTAAATYFGLLRQLLQTPMGFRRRQAHPPSDPINALLSLGYTLLYNHLYAAINVVGLDPYQGFMHQIKHGHAALASDLIEEWRAIIVDSVVLTVINRREIQAEDFQRTPQGWRLSKEALTRFVQRYDERVSEEIFAPAIQGRTSYRRCFELQVRHLVRVIRSEEDTYQPFTPH
jgi:CRISPR-associated protein Cas1